MANYQVLFNGEVADQANPDHVRENLARELGLDERKARQLFSGRTVVIRSQLDQDEAFAWQEKLNQLGAVCRVKDVGIKMERAQFASGKAMPDQTLRDITAAHTECPRCGHMQLDSSHCARCGTDLVAAFKMKRKEDLLIAKKISDLRAKNEPEPELPVLETAHEEEEPPKKRGMLGWLSRG